MEHSRPEPVDAPEGDLASLSAALREREADDSATAAQRILPWVASVAAHAGMILLGLLIPWTTARLLADRAAPPAVVAEFNELTFQPLSSISPDDAQREETAFEERARIERADPSESLEASRVDPASLIGPSGGEEVLSGFTPRGGGNEVTFGGLRGSNARHIVYVVDASGSMIAYLPILIDELVRSIDKLNESQSFRVVFFQRNEAVLVPGPGEDPEIATKRRRGTIRLAGCWSHGRRGFVEAEPAYPECVEVLDLIAKLFDIERRMKVLPVSEKTVARADAARPVLAMLDAWVARNRDKADPRGPLAQAIGYYDNQREALHQFLTDGRLRLDNSVSEQQLRNVALGRHNWTFFENETGLRWYCAFRSLIASCALHGINAHEYLEQLLRLAPSWPVARVLELAPKYWKGTLAKLDARQRATLERPWERTWPTVISPTPSTSAAA